MLPLASFTLRFSHGRARVAPETNLSGNPFEGPAVDLLRTEAVEAIRLAHPLLRVLEACEPGARVRSLAADLRNGNVVATLEAPERPRVVRLPRDQGGERILDAAGPLLEYLATCAARALVARGDP